MRKITELRLTLCEKSGLFFLKITILDWVISVYSGENMIIFGREHFRRVIDVTVAY